MRLVDTRHPIVFEAEGSRVGPYGLLRTLGSGGMGTVYEAEQEKPRRRVALKVLRGTAGQSTALKRFEGEAEVLAKMDHPGIARVAAQYDWLRSNGCWRWHLYSDYGGLVSLS